MSEGEAVAVLLIRCNAIDERDAKRSESRAIRAAGKNVAERAGVDATASAVASTTAADRDARRAAWRHSRDEMHKATRKRARGETENPREVVADAPPVETLPTSAEAPLVAVDALPCMAAEAPLMTGEALMEAPLVAAEDAPGETETETEMEMNALQFVADSLPVAVEAPPMAAEMPQTEFAMPAPPTEVAMATVVAVPPAIVAAVPPMAIAAPMIVGANVKKRAREDAIFEDYKRRKGSAGNAIIETMQAHTMVAFGHRSAAHSWA
jgi:hypothetical protein